MKLDSTRLGEYQRCPYYYYLKNVLNWHPKVVANELTFGTIMHESLMIGHQKGVEEAVKVWSKYEAPSGEQLRTRTKGEMVVSKYFQQYPKDWEILEYEKVFEVPIKNHIFFGRMDMIIKWSGQLWVVDHKTSRTLEKSFFKGFRPHNQSYGYTYALRKLYNNEGIGIIINGVLINKTEALEGRGKPKLEFMRVPISPIPEDLESWENSFLTCCEEIEYRMDTKKWQRAYSNCHQFFKECDMFNLCVYNDTHEFEQVERKI